MSISDTCPLCSEKRNFEFIETHSAYKILHCPDCDLIFSSPMKSADAAWYDKAYLVRHHALDDRIRQYFRLALMNIPTDSKAVLDIGCGEGVFVNFAAKNGRKVSGIDISEKAIEAGKTSFGGIPLYKGDIYNLPEELERLRGKFDAVTAFEVIEHLEDPLSFLNESGKLLKPDGLLIASVPNRDRFPMREFIDYPPHHLTRWNRTSLERLFESAGFEKVIILPTGRMESINFFLGNFSRLALHLVTGSYNIFKGMDDKTNYQPSKFRDTLISLLSKYGSGLRKFRDIVLWIPTIILAPFLLPLIKGYNLIIVARNPQ